MGRLIYYMCHLAFLFLALRPSFSFLTFQDFLGCFKGSNCKESFQNALVLYSAKGQEGWNVFMNKHSPHVLARGVRPYIIPGCVNQTQLVYYNEGGEKTEIESTSERGLKVKLLEVLPKAHIHPLVFGTTHTEHILKTEKKRCVTVVNSLEQIESYYSYVRGLNTTIPYLFLREHLHHTSPNHHLQRHLGHLKIVDDLTITCL